jgi:hypothetical protein
VNKSANKRTLQMKKQSIFATAALIPVLFFTAYMLFNSIDNKTKKQSLPEATIIQNISRDTIKKEKPDTGTEYTKQKPKLKRSNKRLSNKTRKHKRRGAKSSVTAKRHSSRRVQKTAGTSFQTSRLKPEAKPDPVDLKLAQYKRDLAAHESGTISIDKIMRNKKVLITDNMKKNMRKGQPSEIVSVADGEVIKSAKTDENGQTIIIRHDGGFITSYYHLTKRHVKSGDKVREGQKIGTTGGKGELYQFRFKVSSKIESPWN